VVLMKRAQEFARFCQPTIYQGREPAILRRYVIR
jgi:hypothetical protein